MKRSTLVVCVIAVAVTAAGIGALALASAPSPVETTTSPVGAPDGEASFPAAAHPTATGGHAPTTHTLTPRCPVTMETQGDATALPRDLVWTTAGDASWPTSATVGPTGSRDGLPACFERSDRGAALAAATILFAEVARSPLQTWPTYAAPTPGLRKMLETVNGHSDSALRADVTAAGTEAVGYRIDASDSERVELTLALRVAGDPALHGWPVVLVWNESDAVGGDWLVRVREDGVIGDPMSIEKGAITTWPR